MKAKDLSFEVRIQYLPADGGNVQAVESPTLTGESGLAEIAYTATMLTEASATVNDACSLRVTVDIAALSKRQAKRVERAFHRYGAAFPYGIEAPHEGRMAFHFRGTLDIEPLVTAVYMAVGLVAHASETRRIGRRHIEDTVEAAQAFIADVWSSTDNRIIPDESVDGPISHLLTQCRTRERAARIVEIDAARANWEAAHASASA